MRILALLLSTLSYCFISTHAYRDGAREESCYNHTIVHDNAFVRECATGCRYFLIVKEVVNETTLELGNETTSYECGKVYGIEVANDLNTPEGYLVQARDGTEDSSEIIGTFLNPTVVEERNPNLPRNFKILQCRSSMSSTGELLDNSVTHPNVVNMAGTLQLYWQAPNCTHKYLPNVTLWFTIVQQLTIVYNPSKSTVLTYIQGPGHGGEASISPQPSTTTATTTQRTTMNTEYLGTRTTTLPFMVLPTPSPMTTAINTVPHTEPEGMCPSNSCVVAATMTALVCSLIFSVSCGIVGGFCGRWITLSRQRKQTTNDNPLPTDAIYEDVPDRAARSTPNEAMELTVNEAYGHITSS